MRSLRLGLTCLILLTSEIPLFPQSDLHSAWRLVKVPATEGGQLRGIVFVNDRVGWVCAGRTTILKTVDGGRKWASLKSNLADPDTDILRLWFIDEIHGWAAGTIGRQPTVWQTNDAGVSWTVRHKWPPMAADSSAAMLDIQFVDKSHGWAVGYNGLHAVIAATVDGGEHWETQYSGSEITGQLSRVRFANRLSGWALSPDGVMETEDGGEFWSLRYFGSALLNDIDVASLSNVWVAGGWGTLLRGDRRGWSEKDIGHLVDKGFLAWVKFANESVGWASGVKGDVVMTRDGGKTWSRDFPDKTLLTPELSTGEMTVTASAVYIIVHPGHVLMRSIPRQE